jgi:hypothetical protein
MLRRTPLPSRRVRSSWQNFQTGAVQRKLEPCFSGSVSVRFISSSSPRINKGLTLIPLVAWLAAVGLTFQEWRTGKRIYRPQDTPFVRPAEPPAHDEDDDEPFSPPSRRQTEDDSYDNRPPVASPFADSNRYTGAAGRPSMDAYGAFDDPTPSGYDQPYQPPVSRTMQIADPYAAVKASIHQGNNVSPNPPILPPLPSYNDTGYSGYRS